MQSHCQHRKEAVKNKIRNLSADLDGGLHLRGQSKTGSVWKNVLAAFLPLGDSAHGNHALKYVTTKSRAVDGHGRDHIQGGGAGGSAH